MKGRFFISKKTHHIFKMNYGLTLSLTAFRRFKILRIKNQQNNPQAIDSQKN